MECVMDGLVVAIDGPAGSGKSSVAKGVATALALAYLDTGAMYRAATWWCEHHDVDLADAPATAAAVAAMPLVMGLDPVAPTIEVSGVDVAEAIRRPEVSAVVSKVATNLDVRAELVARQQAIVAAERAGGFSAGCGVVVEGRDITTVVAPDAQVRVLLTASPAVRLARRAAELHGEASEQAVAATRDQVLRRDAEDSTVVEFHQAAPGVTVVDSTDLDLDQTVAAVLALVTQAVSGSASDPAPAAPELATPRLEASGGPVAAAPAPAAAREPDASGLSTTSGARGAPKTPGWFGPAWSRWLGRFLFRIVWNARPIGKDRVPRTGPVILAANHQHWMDGPMLIGMAPRPLHLFVKQELFHGPFGLLLRTAGQIKTDRANGRAALTQGLGVLKRGGAIGIFPEGERGSGKVQSTRAGAAWLAVHGHAQVVPVAILGTRRPGEDINQTPPPRRRLVIEFGDPIDVTRDDLPRREAVTHATETIRAALATLVADASARTGLGTGAEPAEA